MRKKIDLIIKITDEVETLVFCALKKRERVKVGHLGVFETRIQKGRVYKTKVSPKVVRRKDHHRLAFIPSTTFKRAIK